MPSSSHTLLWKHITMRVSTISPGKNLLGINLQDCSRELWSGVEPRSCEAHRSAAFPRFTLQLHTSIQNSCSKKPRHFFAARCAKLACVSSARLWSAGVGSHCLKGARTARLSAFGDNGFSTPQIARRSSVSRPRTAVSLGPPALALGSHLWSGHPTTSTRRGPLPGTR